MPESRSTPVFAPPSRARPAPAGLPGRGCHRQDGGADPFKAARNDLFSALTCSHSRPADRSFSHPSAAACSATAFGGGARVVAKIKKSFSVRLPSAGPALARLWDGEGRAGARPGND